MELRKVLVGEQPRQISAQRKVGAAESFMSVSPSSLAFRAVGPFLQKCAPLCVPVIELSREFLPRCPCECESDGAQFFSRFELRTACEPQGDRLELMELAELHRNAGVPLLEQRPDTLPPIDDEGLKAESCRFEHIETGAIVFHLLAHDLFPVQIPAVGTTYQKTIPPGEECRIHQKVHRTLLRDDLPGRRSMRIEVFAKRLGVFAIPFLEIVVGLPTFCVIVVGIGYPLQFFRVSTHKLTTANDASKLLPARLVSIFLDSQ